MRRWVLAFLMAVTANWVSLIYAFGPVSWLLTTILLLGEFLYFNLRPIEKSGAPTKRIWYLKSGCELLRLFLITATVTVFVQMVWLWCQISMITPENSLAAGTAVAGAAFGVLWAVLLEAIVFWNGMIRVYLTSVQLGLKHRVLAALCGWIPILNIWYLRKIIRITADEAEFETEKWELDTALHIGETFRRHELAAVRQRMAGTTGHEQRRFGVQAAVQEIADRHETLAAPGLQLRDDARQVLQRAVHRIMEEEDAAQIVVDVALAPRVDQSGVIFAHAPPVLAVQRPEHDLEIHLLGRLQGDVIERTVRRTQEAGLDAQGAQEALHPADLFALGRQVEMAQVGMGIGMDADLVAFVMDALHEVGPVLGVPPQHEEGGRDVVRGQDVEDLRRIGRRAVIEAQGAEVLLHGLRDDAHPVVDPAL